MRPIWTGSVSFGLVNIPVKVYLAAKTERIGFRMLHRADEAPIQLRRFCSAEDKEVPHEEIVRGHEYEKGAFVVIADEDLERIERPAASHTLDVQRFVNKDEISPLYFETPYYLEPAKGAERSYALLRHALKQSGKVGVGRVVLKEREYLAAVHVVGEALCMSTMRFAAEIREPKSLALPPEQTELPERQLQLAQLLIDELSAPFDPSAFRDDYQERVQKMIEQKLAGMPPPKRPPLQPSAQVVDLADALQRSIDQAKGRGGAAVQGERRAPRQAAARQSRRGPSKKK